MEWPFIAYNTTMAVPYTQSTTVKRVNNCNGFIAVNTGDDIVFVNDQILYPGTIGILVGDSRTWGGNLYEIYLGAINIRFNGVGANPEVTIEQKFYIMPNNKVLI